jgi:toxin ParE1/3/4
MAQIKWLASAVKDIDCVYEFISQDRPLSAKKVVQVILDYVEKLSQYPESGKTGRVVGTREIVIHPYPFVVIYRIKKNDVQILSVLHTSRKWPR